MIVSCFMFTYHTARYESLNAGGALVYPELEEAVLGDCDYGYMCAK